MSALGVLVSRERPNSTPRRRRYATGPAHSGLGRQQGLQAHRREVLRFRSSQGLPVPTASRLPRQTQHLRAAGKYIPRSAAPTTTSDFTTTGLDETAYLLLTWVSAIGTAGRLEKRPNFLSSLRHKRRQIRKNSVTITVNPLRHPRDLACTFLYGISQFHSGRRWRSALLTCLTGEWAAIVGRAY